MSKDKKGSSSKNITQNRKARHDYHLLDRYEAGIALKGTEVKSIRNGNVSLAESYVKIENGEAFLIDAHIASYDYGTHENHDPKRPRKLLLHRKEIKKLDDKIRSGGMTIVPTRAYFSRGNVKIEIALARGKQDHDKRDAIRECEDQRTIDKHLR